MYARMIRYEKYEDDVTLLPASFPVDFLLPNKSWDLLVCSSGLDGFSCMVATNAIIMAAVVVAGAEGIKMIAQVSMGSVLTAIGVVTTIAYSNGMI